MTYLPQLERDLVQLKRRRARGARLVPAILLVAALAGGTAIVGALEPDPEIEAPRPANPGPDPLASYEQAPPESGHRYRRPPTLLATAHQDGTVMFHVIGYELEGPSGNATGCLDIRFPDSTGAGCFTPSEHAQGIAGGMSSKVAVGATTRNVSRIDVSYRQGDHQAVAVAVLARADDGEALHRAGIGGAFTFYAADIPRDARPIAATAFDGELVVWRAEFPASP
jgi:hypothetical protein